VTGSRSTIHQSRNAGQSSKSSQKRPCRLSAEMNRRYLAYMMIVSGAVMASMTLGGSSSNSNNNNGVLTDAGMAASRCSLMCEGV